jgi:hypothetical protein
MSGDGTAVARALARGLVDYQRVEQDVGAHDDRRVSVFEQKQTTYRLLQGVLLGLGGLVVGGVVRCVSPRALPPLLAALLVPWGVPVAASPCKCDQLWKCY